MEAYKQWVCRNREYVHSIGSLANGLTWLLPEKFSASEIGPEAVTAFLGIFTTINEHIIENAPTPRGPVVSSGTDSSLSYPLLIAILKDLETVVEVAAEHFYGDKKWNFIIATEAMKALIRLALFRNSGYKMLLQGGETSNEDKDSNQPELQNRPGSFDRNNGPYSFSNQNPWNVEGRAMSALTSFGQNARTRAPISPPLGWSRRIHQQQGIIEPVIVKEKRKTFSELVSEKGIKGMLYVMGEVLFITRPLIYVMFIRRYGVRSWIPWAISLSVDTLGMGILANSNMFGEKSKEINFSQPERDELRRRKLLWALYLMRDPFFTKYTRQKLESSQKALEPVPLIGFLTEKLVELLEGAQSRYTYISGS